MSASLKKLAFEHKDTVQIGRTHGMHAEPITFGLKVALWWDEIERHRSRFAAAAEEMRVGKISGAVGTFAHIGPEAEEKICARLGLKAAPISSQVLSRDLHAHYVAVLAGIASSLDKIAHRDPAPATDGGKGGGRAVCGRPEGILRYAAQAESDHL